MANLNETTVNGDLKVNGIMYPSDRLGTVKALTDENVGTNTQYFLSITLDWGKGGHCSVPEAQNVLELGTTAYTNTSDYSPSIHNHDTTYMKASAGDISIGFGETKTIGTINGSNVNIALPASPFSSSGTYDSLTAGYAKNATGALAQVLANNQNTMDSISTNINNLLDYADQGFVFENWKYTNSGATLIPTTSGTLVDQVTGRSDSNKRVIGFRQFMIENQTSSDGYVDFRVYYGSVSNTYTLLVPRYSATPFTQIMNLNAYTYKFSVFKNSSLSAPDIKVSVCGVVITNKQEKTIGAIT